jgi:ribonuclease HI
MDDTGTVIVRRSGFVGRGPAISNNVAEYAALCEALRFLIQSSLTNQPIEVRSDSRLVVNQMRGEWKFRKGRYAQKYREAKEMTGKFGKIRFKWVPREQNKEADALSREAYRGANAFR